MSSNDLEKCNLYEPGTPEYYRDTLSNIYIIGRDYDGYDTNNAKQMKELVDSLTDLAKCTLNHEELYWGPKDAS